MRVSHCIQICPHCGGERGGEVGVFWGCCLLEPLTFTRLTENVSECQMLPRVMMQLLKVLSYWSIVFLFSPCSSLLPLYSHPPFLISLYLSSLSLPCVKPLVKDLKCDVSGECSPVVYTNTKTPDYFKCPEHQDYMRTEICIKYSCKCSEETFKTCLSLISWQCVEPCLSKPYWHHHKHGNAMCHTWAQINYCSISKLIIQHLLQLTINNNIYIY